MMKQLILSATLVLAACAATDTTETPTATAPSAETEVNAFLDGFLKTWNVYDGAGIATNYYRMGNPVETQATNSNKMFDDLRAQGFKETVFRERLVCVTSPTKAHAPVKFERLKTDGTAMPPGLRALTFDLTKFEDGWRATRLVQQDATKPLSCETPLPAPAAN
jgi:hypothetical protein